MVPSLNERRKIMKELKEIKTVTYQVTNEFYVDIVTGLEPYTTDCWLYNKHYDVKMYMFGLYKENLNKVKEIVVNNVDEYIWDYERDYMVF